MATSTIYLFHDTQLTPQRNFKIDDILSFLNLKTKTPITNFQYIKHGLNITIKVDMNQDYLDLKDNLNYWDYCQIVNSNTAPSYAFYFITSAKWRGQSTIEFELYMDTINTFNLGTDYQFSNRTLVHREHRDRFTKVETINHYSTSVSFIINDSDWRASGGMLVATKYLDIDNLNKYKRGLNAVLYNESPYFIELNSYGIENNQLKLFIVKDGQEERPSVELRVEVSFYYSADKLVRKIDIYSEGLNPVLYRKEKGFIERDNLDWYLIYRNQTEPTESLTNPVDCFLCASESFKLEGSPSGDIITPNAIPSGTFYYFSAIDNSGLSVEINGQTYTNYGAFAFFSHDGQLDFYSIQDAVRTIGTKLFNIGSAKLSRLNCIYRYSNNLQDDVLLIQQLPSSTYVPEYNVNAINTINRTEPKLIKIIKLPYCPYPYTKNGEKYVFDVNKWEYDNTLGVIRLRDLSTKFNYSFTSELESPYKPLWDIDLSNISANDIRSIDNESKMFHSDFYQNKLVYDSFSIGIRLEAIGSEEFFALENWEEFEIKYTTTSTINSRFMFSLPQYICPDYATEDYLVMPISRNNDITLYNQQYINYLRTGFNYDVKTKNREETTSWITFGLGLLGSIISFATGNAFGVVGGITLATGAVSSAIKGIANMNQMEQNLAQKQLMLKNQSTSVYGSDDVDLMSEYAKNRIKYEVYSVSPQMREQLYNLFFHFGYVANYRGIPNLNTRTKFNFIQADIDFVNVSGKIDNSMKQDIETRYQEGLTIFHDYGGANWDLTQSLENWEVSLFN